MSECLYCGDCCERFSPLSDGPCPYLVRKGRLVFCRSYDKRPDRCSAHGFPMRFCPIGYDKLGLTDIDSLRRHIDDGWAMIKAAQDKI